MPTAVRVIIPSIFAEFPECSGYDFSSQPQYLAHINSKDGGFEDIVKRWSRPLAVYASVPIGERDEADIQAILYFWHCMGGRAQTFNIKDWTDYKSCTVDGTITALDQPLQAITLDDASTGYQLIKEYAFGPLIQVREITKPIGSTILLANASGTAQVDFAIDESTGLLKPGGTFSGTPHSWGGEFNVPVRFDSELDIMVADEAIQSAGFSLREKRQKQATKITVPPPPGSLSRTFTFQGAVAPATLFAVEWGGAAGIVMGSSSGGGNSYRSTNNGVTWGTAISALAGSARANCFGANKTSGTILAGGGSSQGTVYRSTDGGVTWSSAINVGASGFTGLGSIIALACDGAGNWVAIGNTGFSCYAYSHDDGLTWTAPGVLQFTTAQSFGAFWDSFNSQFVFVANDRTSSTKFAMFTSPTGVTWTESSLFGTPVTQLTTHIGHDNLAANYMVGINQSTGGAAANVRIASTTPLNLITATTQDTGGVRALVTLGANGTFFEMDNTGGMLWTTDDLGATWAAGDLKMPALNSVKAGSVCYDPVNKIVTAVANANVSTYHFP